ncbi:alpha/beta hydrolase [Streptomyces sp. NPDC092296]|uniref:alpha/beta hydrolase n=1 Tax=Streptomyces sp. NPDC092296 TaxID=3366012 RepID=UPI00381768C5
MSSCLTQSSCLKHLARRGTRAGLAAALVSATALSGCAVPSAHRAAPIPGLAPAAAARQAAATLKEAPCGKPPVKLEPKAQDFLNQLAAAGGPPLYTLSYAAARASLDKLQAGPVAKPAADITERTIPGGPTGSVSLRIVRPAGVTGTLPGIVYIHGGGWILGNAMTHDRLVRQLAVGARAAIVFVNYTPSPEAQYPVPLEQIYTASQWVARNGRSIGIDPGRLAVAGDSVGGNMAAALTMLAKERGGPHFRRQALLYPVTDARFDTGSYRRFAEGCWLTLPAMKWFWNAYAPNAADRDKPTVSPLRATLAQLRGLPPALVITDSDVLSDEGMAYADKLRQAGVAVTGSHYPAITHDFMMLNALAGTQADKDAVAETTRMLREALYAPADPSPGKGK